MIDADDAFWKLEIISCNNLMSLNILVIIVKQSFFQA